MPSTPRITGFASESSTGFAWYWYCTPPVGGFLPTPLASVRPPCTTQNCGGSGGSGCVAGLQGGSGYSGCGTRIFFLLEDVLPSIDRYQQQDEKSRIMNLDLNFLKSCRPTTISTTFISKNFTAIQWSFQGMNLTLQEPVWPVSRLQISSQHLTTSWPPQRSFSFSPKIQKGGEPALQYVAVAPCCANLDPQKDH